MINAYQIIKYTSDIYTEYFYSIRKINKILEYHYITHIELKLLIDFEWLKVMLDDNIYPNKINEKKWRKLI